LKPFVPLKSGLANKERTFAIFCHWRKQLEEKRQGFFKQYEDMDAGSDKWVSSLVGPLLFSFHRETQTNRCIVPGLERSKQEVKPVTRGDREHDT